jgi:hypothetical protein
MASESTVQRQVWAALAIAGTIVFRTNSGKAWLSGGGKVVHLPNGTVMVPHGRPVGLGLAMVNGDTVPGLSDLTGYTKVTITPEMVGRTVPIFTVIETKESGGGRRRENQVDFIAQVRKDGGIGGFASSSQQALEIVEAWKRGDGLT